MASESAPPVYNPNYTSSEPGCCSEYCCSECNQCCPNQCCPDQCYSKDCCSCQTIDVNCFCEMILCCCRICICMGQFN